MEEYIIDKLFISTWGVEKTVELALVGICAATVSIIIANHVLPNSPAIETNVKEN